MNGYTIYCTEEQTNKALELGAPIKTFDVSSIEGKNAYNFPTAEQMTAWLEEQGIALDIHTYFCVDNGRIHHYQFTVTDSARVFNGEYSSRKEATLAAIDAALKYLKESRKNENKR